MKPRIIITALIFSILGMAKVHGQEWIGTAFELDTSIILRPSIPLQELTRIKCCIHDGTFYYTDMQAFQHKDRDYSATIHSVSLYDYAQAEFLLPLPPTKERKELLSSRLWIYDFDFDGDRLAVSTQDQLLLYHKSEGTYIFDTMYLHPNSKAVFIHNGMLNYLEEDHDAGYIWFQRAIKGGGEKLLQKLDYEAPHVVQANPNRYLFHDSHALYFLSTRFPVLHRYDLDGHFREKVSLDIPIWHPFEDEYIRKSLSVPYGAERIYATMGEIFRYSYPKVLFPLGNTLLLYYTQFDTLTGKSAPAYAILDRDGHTRLYLAKDTSNAPYVNGRFPFNLFNVQEDKAHISWNNLLIEISAEDTSDWYGKRPEEHKRDREAFFKRNEPVFKIKIMRHKNNDPTVTPFFVDTESSLQALEDLPSGKSIILVNHELECSACVNHLLHLLNDSSATDVHIGILYPYIPGALQEREMSNRIKAHLERPFRLYYLNRKQFASYPSSLIKEEATYPALLFFEKGRAPILHTLDDIYDDNPYTLTFRESFLEFWRQFHTDTGGWIGK
ncbi:MAG: hypothetical protein II899_06630 [Bacteroidales bacterium]|nr:hypothetical protein [Bacteroidales bacterium]